MYAVYKRVIKLVRRVSIQRCAVDIHCAVITQAIKQWHVPGLIPRSRVLGVAIAYISLAHKHLP